MSHTPIHCRSLGLSFSHKTCFTTFDATIYPGDRIALIGRNGCGKSTLLAMLAGIHAPSEGDIVVPEQVRVAYVPQIMDYVSTLNGAARFHTALTVALAQDPEVLLLDEPTNHLDKRNRLALMRMLMHFSGTLIIASHDVALLRQQVNQLWHMDDGRVHVFHGHYDDYQRAYAQKHAAIERELMQCAQQRHALHDTLMQEQARAKRSRAKGEKHIQQRKWPTIVSTAKAGRAEMTSGRKRRDIHDKKQQLEQQRRELRLPEVIQPNFELSTRRLGERDVLQITDGVVGYDRFIIQDIQLRVRLGDKIVIHGDNGSGKSTLLKAIIGDSTIKKAGIWVVPKQDRVGYLDQHYQDLASDKTVLALMREAMPGVSHARLREHLNRFLFRKNVEVNLLTCQLSGGERVRLSLALIAAHNPDLLVLDEITNNVDLETRAHIIQVLQAYPGAIIMSSHDEDFLQQVGVTHGYVIEDGQLTQIHQDGIDIM